MTLTIRKRHAALADQMLHYFTIPRKSLRLHLQPEFEGYTAVEIRTMLHALNYVDLIVNVSMRQTRGSIYQITAKGKRVIQIDAKGAKK